MVDPLTLSLYLSELNRVVIKHTNKKLFGQEVLDFDFSEVDIEKIANAILLAEDPLSFHGVPFCAIYDGAKNGNKDCSGCPISKHDHHCLETGSFIFKAKGNLELDRNYKELTSELKKIQRLIREEMDD